MVNFQLSLETIVRHYKNLLAGRERVGDEVYEDSFYFHESLMRYRGSGFNVYGDLGMYLTQREHGWTSGFQVLDSDAWVYHTLPSHDQATLAQSLLLAKTC